MSNAVRNAFRDQANWCKQLGSPFTARVCGVCAERLAPDLLLSRSILNWPGDPSAKADSVPLRLAGALHYLARNAISPRLSSVYPPHSLTDDELWDAIRAAFIEHGDTIREYLSGPPQTNEVMRSAALLPGLLKIAALTQQPLELYEIGASAGLNLILDRYRYQFGDASWGDAKSPVLIKPQWQGSVPRIDAPLRIASRRGVDLNPIDLKNEEARQRLLSYVWVDQSDRVQRLDSAMSLWSVDPPSIERADAAEWLEQSQITYANPNKTRVLFHSITWSYFPDPTKQRIQRLMQATGEQASNSAPVAWLRYELGSQASELKLMLWPNGEDILLATGNPHGSAIQWLE